MKNGEIFYSFDINTLRVIKLCVVNSKEGYVNAVEVYGTTTCNLRPVACFDIYFTPEEAYKGMLESVNRISEIYFREDYGEQNGKESEQ